MTIDKASKLVNLSKKAIRLYESRGLFRTERRENGYRSYSEDDIKTLSKIKLLRMMGISLSDIKLLFDGFLSQEELMEKRRTEIIYEFGTKSEQMKLCEECMQRYRAEAFECVSVLNEGESESAPEPEDLLSIGIDIGTTTISLSVVNLSKKETVEVYNIPNNSRIHSENPAFSLQDPNVILENVKKLLERIIGTYPGVRAIGITGQMHGILYLDASGNAISDFINWQDKRAALTVENGKSTCERIHDLTGYRIAAGFGFATHVYNSENGMVPAGTHTMCNITDFVAMRLAGNPEVTAMHTSIAASLGLYDLGRACFDADAIAKLNMRELCLPPVTDDATAVGFYCGIPVFVPIGDHQASFFGSVDNAADSILVNIGTGSQISAVANGPDPVPEDLELRPFYNGRYLLCGCSLCGGASYALLERFFRQFASATGGGEEPLYNVINSMVKNAHENRVEPLLVKPFFGGKRSVENATGAILGITDKNFAPEALALGFVHGICRELYDFFDGRVSGRRYVIASGNAVQKNPVFKEVLSTLFGLPVKVSKIKEEASLGAALFAAVGADLLTGEEDFSSFIKYGD